MESINLLSQALLGSVIALFGGVIFLYNRKLSSVLEKYSVPFAAGVLVTVSILGLIPEAEQYARRVYLLDCSCFVFGSLYL